MVCLWLFSKLKNHGCLWFLYGLFRVCFNSMGLCSRVAGPGTTSRALPGSIKVERARTQATYHRTTFPQKGAVEKWQGAVIRTVLKNELPNIASNRSRQVCQFISDTISPIAFTIEGSESDANVRSNMYTLPKRMCSGRP